MKFLYFWDILNDAIIDCLTLNTLNTECSMQRFRYDNSKFLWFSSSESNSKDSKHKNRRKIQMERAKKSVDQTIEWIKWKNLKNLK